MVSQAGMGIESPFLGLSTLRGTPVPPPPVAPSDPETAPEASDGGSIPDSFRERALSPSVLGASDTATEETPARPGVLRTLGLAFMTALSVAGCTAGPGNAPAAVAVSQAAPGPSVSANEPAARPPLQPFTGTLASAQKPVKLTAADYERVYQAVPLLRPHQKGQHPAVRFELVAPTTSPEDLKRLADHYATNLPIIDALLDPEVSPAQRDDIRRDLGILPTNLLKEARNQGVRIWVANRGVKEVPVRLFTSDAPDLAAGKVQKEEVQVKPASDRQETSKGKKGEAAPRDFDAHPGDTIETLARRRGATTPEQVAEFVRLTVQMNAGGVFAKPLDPTVPLTDGQRLKIPDLGFYQGQPIRARWLGSIRNINEDMPVPTVGGFYQHGSRLLVLRSTTLPDPSPKFMDGKRAVVHEFGHVAQSLISDDQKVGDAHFEHMKAQKDAAVARYNAGDEKAFITDYATTNMSEHYAESFEAYFTADRPDGMHKGDLSDGNFRQLQKNAPGYADLIQDEMHLWEQDQIRPMDIWARLGIKR